MANPRIRFKQKNGENYPNLITKKMSEVMEERHVLKTITEDSPLLSFTIENGVIYPEDKKTNKRDFLIKDKDNKKFALTEVDDIIYNPANIKFGAIHKNSLCRGVVSPIYAIFKVKEDPTYMEYYVQRKSFIAYSMKYLEGTVEKLKTLKPNDFLKLNVTIPCIEEQKKIANFLNKIDDIILESEKEIVELEKVKKLMMQKIFSRQVRFKQDNGFEYESWEEKKLEDIAEVVTKGTTPKNYVPDAKINFVRIDSIKNGIIKKELCLKIDEETHNGFLGRSVLKEGDILCSIAGALGVVAIVDESVLPANTNQALSIIRLKQGECAEYIAKVLSSNIMKKYIRECKTIGAQPNLSLAQIKEFKIPYPCLDEQIKIGNLFNNIDSSINLAKEELEKYKELKKGLLQQMFI